MVILLSILLASVLSQDCLLQTPVFGSNLNAELVSDITVLRQTDQAKDLKLSKLVVCGDQMTFKGI
jgi:hypothetical protein